MGRLKKKGQARRPARFSLFGNKHNEMKSLIVVFFCIANSISVLAQGHLSDTLYISPVAVDGAKSKFVPGTQITTISLNNSMGQGQEDLAMVLAGNSSIHIKSYANGLNTISFRGTGSRHTQVFFNGIGFNSFTLGDANLADIPIFFFDEAEIQYGSSVSVYGSGSIGGSIHLYTLPIRNNGNSLTIQQDISSFQNSFTGIKYNIGKQRFTSSTKIFHKYGKNDFPIKNKLFKDFETGEFIETRQKNNRLRNYGIMQEMNFKLNRKNTISTCLYSTILWHEAQATMSANIYGGDFAELFTNNHRIITKYSRLFENQGYLSIGTSASRDFQQYNGNDSVNSNQQIITNLLRIDMALEKRFSDYLILNAGTAISNITADVHSYAGNAHENQMDIYISSIINYNKKGKIHLNFRNGHSSDFKPQISPALGIHQIFNINKTAILGLSSSVSRSYKLPTFNDRYWNPGGNPNLKPESGLNIENNLDYRLNYKTCTIKTKINIYNMIIDNWISWFPLTMEIWSPENGKKVYSRGVEISSTMEQQIGKLKYAIKTQYSHNKSTPLEVYGTSEFEIGKQLPYSPNHTGLVSAEAYIRKWFFNARFSYTGKRNNSTYSQILEDYFLTNLSVGRKLTFKTSSMDFHASVNNLFNNGYINIENYAMPGINWKFGIKYNFKNN